MRADGGSVLLVEGKDDKIAVIRVLDRHLHARGQRWDDLSWRPDVQDRDGVDGVLESLGVSLKSTPRLGVVVDADHDRDARWRALLDRLRRAGLTLPDAPPEGGHVGPGLLPGSRLGLWLMPDNRLPGTLEDFLGLLVPAADPHWPHAGEAVSAALARDGRARNEAWKSKARLHTWLAWQERPGQPLGTAVTARVLSELGHPRVADFAAWFERVFGP